MKTDLDTKLYSAAAVRNKDVICEVLEHVLPASGLILELGAGSGEHAVHFARNLPHLVFQPTDPSKRACESITTRIHEARLENIRPVKQLNMLDEQWDVERPSAIIAINVCHIASWDATLALLEKAADLLPSGAPLFFYGPFFRSDMKTAESNVAFDAQLRQQNPAQGLRYLDDLATHATDAAFSGPHIIHMPANNLCVIFKKQ